MGINKKRLVKEFVKLVRIDSISKKEGKIAGYIKKELKDLGLRVKEDNAGSKLGGESGNIIGYMKGVKKYPRLLFNAHLDTHIPGENIKPKIRGLKIYSSGDTILGADDKAGVAAMLEMIKVIKEDKISHGDLVILFTVAEEIGLAGAKHLKKKDIAADAGFAIDGGRSNKIVISAPEQVNIEVDIKGRAAHAGVHPEHGLSAIKVAAKAISCIKEGRIDFETTANIGIIKGGMATNIVPEH
ncbi:MAG: M20/M25/M40 family metallo-hydrolase, partial [bacterium]